MDQASHILAQWPGVSDVTSQERIACGVWKRAVGKTIAQRTRALKLVRTTLVVEVEDELWKKNLWGLRYQILRNLHKALGPDIVSALELRVMPAGIGPQRETGPALEASIDEADAITDPGLRRIFVASRRRESA